MEGIHGIEHAVDERPAASPALGAQGNRPVQAEALQFLVRVSNEQQRVLPDIPQQRSRTSPARVHRERLHSQVVGRLGQLPHQPVDPRRGPPLLRRVDVHTADHLLGLQIGRHEERSGSTGDSNRSLHSAVLAEGSHKRIRTQLRLGKFLAAERRSDFRAEATAEREADVPQQSVESAAYLSDPFVIWPQGAVGYGFPHRHPMRAHVVELQRSGSRCSR